MRRRPRWPWKAPPAEEREPFVHDRPDPARGTRPEGPVGFYWEGLGLAPEGHRGPKGYRRTDARLREEVCDRLTDDHRVDATAIEVRVEDGVVYLRGTVADREQKRRAERIAERAHGWMDVMNELRIRRERSPREPVQEGHAPPSSNGGGRR
jgi:hypothetical protein